MENYTSSTYGDKMADIYDQIQGERDAPDTLDFLIPLAKGKALELGIGTGRVAIPLAQAGIDVFGIDSSLAMIKQLKAKPGGEKISIVQGDMADLSMDSQFPLIFVIFGTFFCLTSQESQIQCFQRVAQHLMDDGVFVIEASVPDFTAFTRNQNVRLSNIGINHVIITSTEHDPVSQKTTTQHLMVTDNGIRLLPVQVRYAYPSEIDLMARLAGLELKERWGDWRRNPFVADSTHHVSVYGWPAKNDK